MTLALSALEQAASRQLARTSSGRPRRFIGCRYRALKQIGPKAKHGGKILNHAQSRLCLPIKRRLEGDKKLVIESAGIIPLPEADSTSTRTKNQTLHETKNICRSQTDNFGVQ